MTMGKMAALSLGLIGGFALGVWTGPYITQRAERAASVPHEYVAVPSAHDETTATGASRPPAPARAKAAAPIARVDLAAPELQAKLKPVLNRGANMTVAAEGFQSAEQFAMVAHAARNTEVPFLLLKHRVLNEGKSLAQAIRESKPEADAAAEAKLARSQAREDIAAIAG